MSDSSLGSVLVVGDVNADYLLRMPSLPPLGEDGQASRAFWSSGGSALNAAVAYRAVGFSVTLLACVGADALGDSVLAFASTRGVGVDLVARDPEEPTGTCVVCVTDDSNRTFLSYRGANRSLALRADPSTLLEGIDLVHVSAYTLLDEVSRGAVLVLLTGAKARGIRAVLDLGLPPVQQQRDAVRSACSLAWLVGGNESEMAALTSEGTDDPGLQSNVGSPWVVTKRGARGASLWSAQRSASCAAHLVKPVDTTGCGDAFMAGCAGILHRTGCPDLALSAGCWLGARTAESEGAAASVPSTSITQAYFKTFIRSGDPCS